MCIVLHISGWVTVVWKWLWVGMTTDGLCGMMTIKMVIANTDGNGILVSFRQQYETYKL
jgi:hypothetical protein